MHDFKILPARYFLVGVFDRHCVRPLLCRGVVDGMRSISVIFNNNRLKCSCKTEHVQDFIGQRQVWNIYTEFRTAY